MKQEISIVIITYNRKDKLERLLQSLVSQTFKQFEIIIVIDGSNDDSEVVAKSYQHKFPKVTVSSHENKGRSFSRNKGASLATNDLLVFFDDDMILFKECVEQHYRHHEIYPGSICIGTQEEDPAKIVTDFDRFRYETSLVWEQNVRSTSGIVPVYDTYLTGANFSINKNLFWQLNGFDLRTEMEDFDLAVTALNNNIILYYNGLARGIHDNPINCRAFIFKQKFYYNSYMDLASLKPELQNRFARTTKFNPSFGKRLIFSAVSLPFMVKLIDRNFFAKIFPRKVRYKLYAVVVTGLAIVFPKRASSLKL